MGSRKRPSNFDFTDPDHGSDAIKQRVLGIDGVLPFEHPCVRTHQAGGKDKTYWDYMQDAGLDPNNWPQHIAEWNPEILDPHRLRPGQQVVLCDPGPPGWSEQPPDYSGAIDGLLAGAAEGGLMGSHPAPYDPTPVLDAMTAGAVHGAASGPYSSERPSPSSEPEEKLGPLGQWCKPNEDWHMIMKAFWQIGAPGCYPGGGHNVGLREQTEEELERERERLWNGIKSGGDGIKRGGRALYDAPGDIYDSGGKTLDGMGSAGSKALDAFVEHLTPF